MRGNDFSLDINLQQQIEHGPVEDHYLLQTTGNGSNFSAPPKSRIHFGVAGAKHQVGKLRSDRRLELRLKLSILRPSLRCETPGLRTPAQIFLQLALFPGASIVVTYAIGVHEDGGIAQSAILELLQ